MGSRSACQKKFAESVSVSFCCQRVSITARSVVITPVKRMAMSIAKRRLNIQFGWRPDRISSKKIWLNTGCASPVTTMLSATRLTKSTAHLSFRSLAATVSITL